MTMYCKRCGEACSGESFAETKCDICGGRAFTTKKPVVQLDEPLTAWELTDHDIIRLIHYGIRYDE